MSNPTDPTPTPSPEDDNPSRSRWRLPGGGSAADAWIHFSWPTKITSMKVLKLTFKNDHQVMTDDNADWTDSGNVFPKPEWTYGVKSNPISISKNQKVRVDVVFEVNPANASTTVCDVTGTAAFGSLVFTASQQSFNGGTTTITAETTGSLPDLVQQLTGDITWSVKASYATFAAGASWGHTLYVTYGTPSGSSVTQMRIAWVTNAANQKSNEQDCVNAIFDAMMKYTYHLGAVPPSPTWKIFGGELADCGILADQFRLACLMLGLPDSFTKGFIYPLLAVGAAKFVDVSGENVTRNLTGSHATSHGAQEKVGWQDGSGGKNNYEGCVKYGTMYYCIGEDRYASPEAAMKAMVVNTFWGGMDGGGGVWKVCKNPGPYPIATW